MRKKIFSNPLLKILSVLLAILIWFLVVNTVDPVTTGTINGIRVEILNPEVITDQGKIYEVTENQTINISVDAKKTDWPSISADDFYAYVDMRYSYGVSEENQAAQIQIEVVNHKSMIDEESIQFRSSNVLYFTTEDVITKEIPVTVQETGELPDNYSLADYTLSPESVMVTAPESVMGRVSSVAVNLDLSELDSDHTDETVSPQVLDANGKEVASEEVSVDTEEVTIHTSLMIIKSVPINCEGVTGKAADGYQYSDLSIEPSEIVIMGSKATLADCNYVLIPSSELDITDATGDIEKVIDLTPYLPEGVRSEGDGTAKVTIHVEALQTRNFRIPVDQIVLENQNPDYEYEISGTTVSVSLIGLKEDLDVLEADSVELLGDVGGKGPGTYSIPLVLEIGTGYEQNGTPFVSVTISGPEQETEEETE